MMVTREQRYPIWRREQRDGVRRHRTDCERFRFRGLNAAKAAETAWRAVFAPLTGLGTDGSSGQSYHPPLLRSVRHKKPRSCRAITIPHCPSPPLSASRENLTSRRRLRPLPSGSLFEGVRGPWADRSIWTRSRVGYGFAGASKALLTRRFFFVLHRCIRQCEKPARGPIRPGSSYSARRR